MSVKKGTFPPVLLTCPVFLMGKKRYFSPDPFNQCFTLVKKRYFSPILVVSVLQWGGKGSSPLALHLGHSALPWQCLALNLGHPTLPCVSPQAMGTQREPSHALRWPWGHPPPNGMWGHPTPPVATGMGPQMLMLVAWHWCTMPCLRI